MKKNKLPKKLYEEIISVQETFKNKNLFKELEDWDYFIEKNQYDFDNDDYRLLQEKVNRFRLTMLNLIATYYDLESYIKLKHLEPKTLEDFIEEREVL